MENLGRKIKLNRSGEITGSGERNNINVEKKPGFNFKYFLNWMPAVAIMTIIFVLSSVNGQTIEKAGLGYDSYHISGHFFLFIILCFAFYKAVKNVFLAVLFTVLYGVFDEIHQIFVPFRSSSFKDVFTDSIGALLSGGFLWKLQHLLPAKLRNWLNK